MKINSTFKTAFLALALSIFSLNAHAENYKYKENSYESKKGTDLFSYTFKDLGIACPSDFYFYGSFLWMKAEEDGLEYAMDNPNETFPVRLPINGGLIGFGFENDDWEWNPGFRVGFGANLNHDAWNIDLSWTFVRIKNDNSYHHIGTGAIVPLWPPSGLTSNSTDNKNASARWKGNFNTIDLALLKPLRLTHFFVLNPTIACQIAVINQDFTFRYGGSWLDTQDGLEIRAHNDFIGIGPKGGLKTEWLLSDSFKILGNISASGLLGRFDINQSMPLTTYSYDLDWKQYVTVPAMELMIGINWGRLFNKNKCYLNLKAGFEYHKWWDQNRLIKFVNALGASAFYASSEMGQPHNDLSLIGFNFGFELDF